MERKSIFIIKPGAIGDLIQLTPVIRALAVRYPGVLITIVVGSEATATLFQHNPHITETIVFDKRVKQRLFSSLLKLWGKIHKKKYDIVIHFQRSNLKAWFLATAAFPCRVLVYHKARSRTVHVVDNYLETVASLGITGSNRELELFLGKDDEQFAEDLFIDNGFMGKVVVALNPGASHVVNRWGIDHFAALAIELSNSLSARIIIIGGKEDAALAEQIASMTTPRPLVLTGTTTLLQLGAILARCDLLVSGDTGPLHLATAVGTRVLALFGAADPARTGPVGAGHRVIQATGTSCVPCGSRTCANREYLECMKNISVKEVADAVVGMVKK